MVSSSVRCSALQISNGQFVTNLAGLPLFSLLLISVPDNRLGTWLDSSTSPTCTWDAPHQVRLLEDQRHALKQVLEAIVQRPDALLIAGDVYDRSVPPTEAVELLKWFIHEVAIEQGVQVVMIPAITTMPNAWVLPRDSQKILHIAPPITADIHLVMTNRPHRCLRDFLDPPLVREVTTPRSCSHSIDLCWLPTPLSATTRAAPPNR